MRRFRYALWPVGLAFGLAAEWIARPELVVLDTATGFALLLLGLVAWSRRPVSRVGPIMAAAGFTWFLGTLWPAAALLHRGPLAHLLLSYPSGRVSSRLERVAIGTAYAYAVAHPVAVNDYATIVYALGLVAVAARRFVVVGGRERRARLASLTASAALGLVLLLEATARLAHVGHDRAALFGYELVVGLIAVGLFADLLWGRWTQTAVTGLVVDLGDSETGSTLRDRLARTLGDPTLVVAYWLPEEGRYVDEAARPVELPATGSERTVTPIEDEGRPIAALIHDPAVLNDPQLISAVASATRLAVSNARLQAAVHARVAEVESSRRRLVEAADAQRHRLGLELRDGAQRRLARIAELLAGSGEPFADVLAGLGTARTELGDFARGIHPATLTDRGLVAALDELARQSPAPVAVNATAGRFPPEVEAAAYFICSEGLANALKCAAASHLSVVVQLGDGQLLVSVEDDGVGGADPASGTGLRGLIDRVEALGGRLDIESRPGEGTLLFAALPVDEGPSHQAGRQAWTTRNVGSAGSPFGFERLNTPR